MKEAGEGGESEGFDGGNFVTAREGRFWVRFHNWFQARDLWLN